MQSPEPDAKSVDTAAFSVHPSIEGTVRSEPRPVELGSAYASGAAIPGDLLRDDEPPAEQVPDGSSVRPLWVGPPG
jgi:hypothetical protein